MDSRKQRRRDGPPLQFATVQHTPIICSDTNYFLPDSLTDTIENDQVNAETHKTFERRDIKKGKGVPLLGTGSQADVYKVQHAPTKKFYALKHFKTTVPDCVQAFEREVLPLYKQVDTTHVVELYEVFNKNGEMEVLMEYMELGSLSDILRRLEELGVRPACYTHAANGQYYCQCPVEDPRVNYKPYGRLCTHDLRYVARSILSAVHALHEKHIIHRDLKPSNVLINNAGVVKICDFGVSRIIESTGQLVKTSTGSPFYIAPERCMQNREYSFPADVWSVGIILGYCALGQHPVGEKLMDVVSIITEPHYLLSFPPSLGLDEEFVDIVNLCCQHESTHRPRACDLLTRHPYFLHGQRNTDGPMFLEWCRMEQRITD
jgi:serine/threonine protein kinase